MAKNQITFLQQYQNDIIHQTYVLQNGKVPPFLLDKKGQRIDEGKTRFLFTKMGRTSMKKLSDAGLMEFSYETIRQWSIDPEIIVAVSLLYRDYAMQLCQHLRNRASQQADMINSWKEIELETTEMPYLDMNEMWDLNTLNQNLMIVIIDMLIKLMPGIFRQIDSGHEGFLLFLHEVDRWISTMIALYDAKDREAWRHSLALLNEARTKDIMLLGTLQGVVSNPTDPNI